MQLDRWEAFNSGTCLGLGAVNNQQPGPFFPLLLGRFKSPIQSVMGKMPATQDLRAISQNSFANQNSQARSAFSVISLWGNSLEDICGRPSAVR